MAIGTVGASAQSIEPGRDGSEGGERRMPPMDRQMQRPSTYQQVDEVRKALGLDNKQFEKVYSAYKKYNKAIYGDESSTSNAPMRGPRPGGGPGGGGMGGPGGGGMGGPGGGGMGGPGGGGMGGPGGGGFGGPGGDMQAPPSDNAKKDAKPMTEKEMEKQRKKMEKQEQKLQKSMLKVLKDEGLYDKWLTIRERQLPMAPGKGPNDGDRAPQPQPREDKQ
jgi:hypothetical protein